MADEPSFVNSVGGFFDRNPVLGGLLSATPWGSRIVGALGTLAAIQQKKMLEQQQAALEGQLSTIGGAETASDPYAGLGQLEGMDVTKFRPDAFRALVTARQNLTSRAAAQALANAQVMDKPGTEQSFGYSPDRAERGGAVPPPRYSDEAMAVANQRNVPVSDLSVAEGTPGVAADRSDRLTFNPVPTFPTAPSESAGFRTGTAVQNAPITPPEYRYPRTEEEMREALSPRDRALYYQATQFKGTPPDTKNVELSMGGKATVNSAEELESMLTGLQSQYDALAPEDQKALAGRLQTARSAVQLAKKNPKALLRSIGSVENFQSALEKHGQFTQTMKFRQDVFQEKKYEFDTNLARVDQQIKQGNVKNAMDLVASMQQEVDKLPGMMDQFQMMGPQYAPVVQSMQAHYLDMVRQLRAKREQLQREMEQPNPSPPTGAGPNPDRGPASRPVQMPQRGTRGPREGAAVTMPKSRTVTLKNGKQVTVEEVP